MNSSLVFVCVGVEDQEMTSDTKILSFEEVTKHNHNTDCWLIISGKALNGTDCLTSSTLNGFRLFVSQTNV
ncbi:putative cytochrome b5-like heme/steroid binding domain superfamily [Helianthus debilis subsp. tardiflorus]